MSNGNDMAFPVLDDTLTPNGTLQLGLTKRELFAAMAMQGSLGGEPGGHLMPDRLAADSVRHADALLAALASPPAHGDKQP